MDIQNSFTSSAITNELGKAVRDYRISSSLTQKDLADRSGVALRSISKFEQGGDIKLGSFIKILQALDLKDNISMLIPDVTKAPSYYLQPKSPKRYKKKKSEGTPDRAFKWGDES